jgi:UDP-3-O-[3-hydroxymyristoyl] glucosamine N-acyltransferase
MRVLLSHYTTQVGIYIGVAEQGAVVQLGVYVGADSQIWRHSGVSENAAVGTASPYQTITKIFVQHRVGRF